MEQFNQSNEITLLFDSFSAESRNLYESFVNVGKKVNAVVLEEDGFLPDGITSIYGYFLGDFSKNKNAKPLYFSDVPAPMFWEIASSNSSGKVMNLSKERARIFYAEPTHKRYVRLIDWVDENGTVRLCEHYNKYGAIFCKTTFNKKGQKVSRNFFDADGKETIVENLVTGDIIVSRNGVDTILTSKQEFILYCLKSSGLANTNIYYNSLSTPFFASLALPMGGGEDILFWSEKTKDAIPGNMQIILNGNAGRTRKIYTQKANECERLIKLGAPKEKVQELGYVYSFIRENQCRKEVLICTNSDNIARLEEITSGLPNLHFHILALTEMSPKLMAFEQKENVTLYPSAKQSVIDHLFTSCDYYFDINHEGEIVDAVHRAFLNQMLILGFDTCIHNKNYIASSHIFEENQVQKLIFFATYAMQSQHNMESALTQQKNAALSLEKADFLRILD